MCVCVSGEAGVGTFREWFLKEVTLESILQ